MAQQSQEEESRKKLAALVNDIATSNPDGLIRSDLGPFNFTESLPAFRRIVDLFRALDEVPLDFVPQGTLTKLVTAAEQMNAALDRVRDFDPPAEQNPSQVQEQIINQLQTAYDKHYENIRSEIAFGSKMGADFSALDAQARQTVQELYDLQRRMEQTLEDAEAQSTSILEGMKSAAADAGVAQTSVAFEDEASTQEKAARAWMWATIAVASLTAVAAVLSFAYWLAWAPEDLSTARAVQIGLAKLLIFSVLYYGLVWTGRNFLAHRHNQTVNVHRQNALRTFHAFVSSASDEATKNAVLLQATQSIFLPQATGYLGTDNSSQNATPQILEIIRGVSRSEPTS